MIEPRLAFTTLSTTEEAESLAQCLVESGLAACVNVVPGVKSFYRWQGKIQQDGEVLLMIKTSSEKWEGLQAAFREHHPYDCPELLLLNPSQVEDNFLAWWQESLPPKSLAATTS